MATQLARSIPPFIVPERMPCTWLLLGCLCNLCSQTAVIRWGSTLGEQEAQARRTRLHQTVMPAMQRISRDFAASKSQRPIEIHHVRAILSVCQWIDSDSDSIRLNRCR